LNRSGEAGAAKPERIDSRLLRRPLEPVMPLRMKLRLWRYQLERR
jgi:hypothetical protein